MEAQHFSWACRQGQVRGKCRIRSLESLTRATSPRVCAVLHVSLPDQPVATHVKGTIEMRVRTAFFEGSVQQSVHHTFSVHAQSAALS